MKYRNLIIGLTMMVLIVAMSCSDKGTDPPGNRAPSITSSASVEAVVDSLFSYTATATDPDGTTPSISIESNPSLDKRKRSDN